LIPAGDASFAKQLVEVCPVNIFVQGSDGAATIVRGICKEVAELYRTWKGR